VTHVAWLWKTRIISTAPCLVIVGPMLARERGINIGYYNTTAYEGIVKTSRATLEIGRRYYFQPRFACSNGGIAG